MFVVLFGVISGIIFMIIAILIALIIMIPSKTGLTLLGKKLDLKFYGLAWIPLVHGWYEGAAISYFWNKEKRSMGLRVIWTILHALFYLLPIAYVTIDTIVTDGKHMSPDYLVNIFVIVMVVMELIYVAMAVIKFLAMKRAGKSVGLSVLVGLLIPFYWVWFMFGKVDKVEPKTYVEV